MRPRYTKAEDKKIIETIKLHPENLQYCFMIAAKKLGRSSISVSNRYYHYIAKQIPENNPIVFVGSPKKVVFHKKQTKDKKSTRFTIFKENWKRILTLIFN